MKKTLVYLTAATLATSSLASTSLVSSETGNLYLDGSVRATFSHNKTTAEDATEKTKLKTNTFNFRVRAGLGYDYNFDGVQAGFYVRSTVSPSKVKTKAYQAKPASAALEYKGEAKSGKNKYSLKADRAYVYLGSDVLGRVTLGNQSTVADEAFDCDLEFLSLNAFSAFRHGFNGYAADTADKGVIKYNSAKYNNFDFGYSFSSSSDSRLNAFTAAYAFADADVRATAGFKKSKNDDSFKTAAANVFDLQVSSSTLVEGLTLSANYAYNKTRGYDSKATEAQTTQYRANSVAAKASYSYNQYVNPYAGVAFEKARLSAYSTGAYATSKTVSAYLGLSSNFYTYESAKFSAFGEVAYSKATSKVSTAKLQNAKATVKSLEFAIGAKASF